MRVAVGRVDAGIRQDSCCPRWGKWLSGGLEEFLTWANQCPADSENKFITTTPPRIMQMPMMAGRSRCCLNTSQPISATSTMPAPDKWHRRRPAGCSEDHAEEIERARIACKGYQRRHEAGELLCLFQGTRGNHFANDSQQKDKILFHAVFCLLITCYGKSTKNKIRLKMRVS